MPILTAILFDGISIASDWQTMVAIAIVFLAAIALAPRVWNTFSSHSTQAGCGSCSGCKKGSVTELPTVNIQLKPNNRR